MPDESDFDAVVARVQLLAQTAIDPALTLTEVQGIVRGTARASTWVTATTYAFGDFVIPTIPNGHRYRVTVAGISGATEPTWGLTNESTVGDGSTLTWQEAGPHTGSVYDIRAAVHEALMVRYSRSLHYVDFSGDGRSMSLHQVPSELLKAAQGWKPLDIA